MLCARDQNRFLNPSLPHKRHFRESFLTLPAPTIVDWNAMQNAAVFVIPSASVLILAAAL
jgi:hypothetical protein